MIVATALALFLRQEPAPPPTFAAGTAPEFAKAALAVEAKLVEGDVAGAREAAKALPVREFRIAWKDEPSLSKELREARTASLERALGSWARAAKGLAAKEVAEGADLTVGFAETLPNGPDGLPLAARVETGPAFRATIGLKKGRPAEPIRTMDLTVELAYALGRYLGVPEAPFPGSAMHRDARPGLLPLMPQGPEMLTAQANLKLSERLREGVAAGKPIGLVASTLRLGTPRLDLGEVRQGQPIRTRIELENLGAARLEFRVEPDCSCFSPFPPGYLPSQGRASIPVGINTSESIGPQERTLLLLTNDPERPQIEIPVVYRSRPAYRLFRPSGPNVVVPRAGGSYDVYFIPDPKAPITPVGWRWDGADGKVKMAPFSGMLPDPEMKEGPMPRKGWRFRVTLSPKLGEGKTPGSLVVATDSEKFNAAIYAMTAQKGIVADEVFLGDVRPGTSASFLVDRPNAPFKILGVDAGPLKAKWKDRRGGWEYQIDLEYKGGEKPGDVLIPVRIRTDDKDQPVVETLVRGIIR